MKEICLSVFSPIHMFNLYNDLLCLSNERSIRWSSMSRPLAMSSSRMICSGKDVFHVTQDKFLVTGHDWNLGYF